MIYLIGGSARCGKTTLARKVRRQLDAQVISQDAVLQGLRSITTPESHPDIFEKSTDRIEKDDPPQKRIARLRRRDEVEWAFMKTYLAASEYSHDDVLNEGCLWPSMLDEFEQEHRAIFLVDTSPDHAKRLIHIRDTSKDNNWMRDRGYTDEYMQVWAEFNIARSKEIIRECEQFGYKYFDIADEGIEPAHEKAYAFLLGKSV